MCFVGGLAAAGDGLLALGNRQADPVWVRMAIIGGLVGAGAYAWTIRGRERMGLLLLGKRPVFSALAAEWRD